MPTELPPRWWKVTDPPPEFADDGDRLMSWLRDTVAKPQPLLGRPGPLCPFVPASLRQDLVFGTLVEEREDLGNALAAQAELFLSAPPCPPSVNAVYKSVLIVFRGLEGRLLTDAVHQVKGALIQRQVTCGEFYPTSDDRSARTERVRVARSPVPLVAMRYLTPHDRLFLDGHPEYGPLFNRWEAGGG